MGQKSILLPDTVLRFNGPIIGCASAPIISGGHVCGGRLVPPSPATPGPSFYNISALLPPFLFFFTLCPI